MRIGVVSDIHGNLLALDAVMTDLDTRGLDAIWCGGDIGFGGPWATECIARVRQAGWPTVKGNTDVWITGRPETIEDEAQRARIIAISAQHAISTDDAEWLLDRPLSHSEGQDVLLVHGTPETPFEAPLDDAPDSGFSCYDGAARLVVYGHIHVAFSRLLASGTLVCNPGSVGMPKDADTASYLIFETTGSDISVRHRRVSFDRRAGIAQARSIGGPLGAMFLAQMGAPETSG